MSNNNNMSTQQIQQTLAEYFATQPVLKAWLFGSYARGEQREDSDVDIMVSLDKSQPIGLKFFGMYVDLKELFLEGDKQEYEAAGHCAAYDLPTGETLFTPDPKGNTRYQLPGDAEWSNKLLNYIRLMTIQH